VCYISDSCFLGIQITETGKNNSIMKETFKKPVLLSPLMLSMGMGRETMKNIQKLK
jgi:hypothetical protein